MDYSVGSVADLISGTVTPNKPKVVAKKLKIKPKTAIIKKEIETTSEKRKLVKKKNKKNTLLSKVKELKPVRHLKKAPNAKQNKIASREDEKPKKKLKRKRSASPKGKQVVDTTEKLNSVDEKDSSDDEQSGNTTKKLCSAKEKHNDNEQSGDNSKSDESEIKEIKLKNPEHTTIFVGNLPITITHKKLQKVFLKFGEIVNARIRSVPVADPKVPKKVAAIKKQFHPDRKSVHGYVTFSKHEYAEKAVSLNGQIYKDHHIRVNICDENQKPDKNKAIFLGNVSFAAEEEELWKLFESCGEIESVRLVRDRLTDIGKGFGYINFKSADSVELALQMGEVKLRDRVLRISLYNGKTSKKDKTEKPRQNLKTKKLGKQKNENALITTASAGQFQGKFAKEKKKKFSKGNHQKKKLAKKIAPKNMST